MLRPEKVKQIEEFTGKFKDSAVVIVANYQGLNVAQMTELRRQFREAEVDFTVYKNTLVRIACDEVEAKEIKEYLTGANAFAFCKDVVSPARVMAEFQKQNPQLEVRCGYLEGRLMSSADVAALAKLPDRQTLLSMVAAGFQSPISGLVRSLNGILGQFVYVLDAVSKQKEESASAQTS